ncbi:MAG: hypothetical protein D6800_07490 [Candidatus Zixiibacteriota bacterium]|nr:MAG: hypothetical protein D6800_07490 [candidate division Zixibacteria bacterium]
MDNPDFAKLAEALGVKYYCATEPLDDVLADALSDNGVSLVEVRLKDSSGYRAKVVRHRVTEAARKALGPRVIRWLRRLLGR